MGMAGPDIVLFVIGALLFGGAVTALVVQGGGVSALLGGSPTGLYSVDYATVSREAAKQTVADFSNAKFDAAVTMRNVSVMHVAIVQCTDAASGLPAGGFNIQLQVKPPAGIEAPKPVFGICGQKIQIDVPVAMVPQKTTVQGGTLTDAQNAVPHDVNESKAMGTWTVTAQGSRGGQAPTLPAGNPGGQFVLTADTWEPRLSAVAK